MAQDPKTTAEPQEKLDAFKNYDDFLNYVRDKFNFGPAEAQSLYKVLFKLQSVGADPIRTMEDCKNKMVGNECLDMLRFMIYVDNMDLLGIKDMTG